MNDSVQNTPLTSESTENTITVECCSVPVASYEVESQPCGFAMDAFEEGETASFVTTAMMTDDNGFEFTSMLQNMNFLFERANLRPNQVQHALMLLEPNRTTVYANESFRFHGLIRARENITAGQAIFRDQIASYERLNFIGIQIPDDAGIVLLLSHGWRRGLFFDFRPCQMHADGIQPVDTSDFGALAGRLMSQLTFSEYFSLGESDWNLVLSAGWFPFLFLGGNDWNFLLNRIRRGNSIEGIEQRIQQHLTEKIDSRVTAWLTHPVLNRQRDYLERSVSHFKNKDWLSCVSVLLPRIEGILSDVNGGFAKHKKTIQSFCENTRSRTNENSLLFADELQRYFRETLFADTEFNSPDAPMRPSRHTIGHGVVSSLAIDSNVATRLLLLVDHLFYCLPPSTPAHT